MVKLATRTYVVHGTQTAINDAYLEHLSKLLQIGFDTFVASKHIYWSRAML